MSDSGRHWIVGCLAILCTMCGCSPSVRNRYCVKYTIDHVPILLPDGEELCRPEDGHAAAISCIRVAPDDCTFVSGDYGGVVKQWALSSGRFIRQAITPDGEAVRALAFSGDGRFLVVVSGYCGQAHLSVLRASTLDYLYTWIMEDGSEALAVSPDGLAIAVGARLPTNAPPLMIEGRTVRIFSRNGAIDMTTAGRSQYLVVTAESAECRGWGDGELRNSLVVPSLPTRIAAYRSGFVVAGRNGPDYGYLGIAERVSEGGIAFLLKGELPGLHDVAAAEAVQTLVTLDYSGTVSVWNSRSGKIIQQFPMPSSVGKTPGRLAMSHDGKYIIRGIRGRDALMRGGGLCVYRMCDGTPIDESSESGKKGQ